MLYELSHFEFIVSRRVLTNKHLDQYCLYSFSPLISWDCRLEVSVNKYMLFSLCSKKETKFRWDFMG